MRADARRRITLYYQTQVSLQGTGSEPLGLGPSSSVENRNPLACLRNAGSYFAITYCRRKQFGCGNSDPWEQRAPLVPLQHHQSTLANKLQFLFLFFLLLLQPTLGYRGRARGPFTNIFPIAPPVHASAPLLLANLLAHNPPPAFTFKS